MLRPQHHAVFPSQTAEQQREGRQRFVFFERQLQISQLTRIGPPGGTVSHPLFILGGIAIFASTPWGRDTLSNPGSHGLSQIIYEFSSAAANNGSGFEGLGDNTPPWNIFTGIIMLFARFIPIIAPLAIAGSLSSKRLIPEGAGTFRTDSWMFGIILLGTILIVGALLFLPLAVLGPIAEHLQAVQ